MMKKATTITKVVIAMSGGVDSSVAAALLKDQGYEVIGITMQIWPSKKDVGGCCSLSAIDDARRVAQELDIPHYILNFRDEFQKDVVDNFIDEYKNGRTPNPCVRCNQFIKFDLLLNRAKELGAEFIATGHYARIMTNDKLKMSNEGTIKYQLFKGKDPKKDQSYFLYTMNQEMLAHTLFPVGEMTKPEVREAAKKIGLKVHDKKESQEICFIEDDDYSRFLRENVPESISPGNIVDIDGKIVGKHEGIAFYTIGQRKGIGAHQGHPKYVLKIDPINNIIVIGDRENTDASELVAENVSFVSGNMPTESMDISAKIRYNSQEAEATLTPVENGLFLVRFKNTQRAITPGQSVVFYDGDEVLGGGIIKQGGI